MEPAELESAQKALAALEHKRVQLAQLLIHSLSESVLHLLLQTLPAGKQFDPTSIVAFLKSTYGLAAKSCFGECRIQHLKITWLEVTEGPFCGFCPQNSSARLRAFYAPKAG